MPAENASGVTERWAPFISYLSKELGVKVNLRIANDYAAVIEGQRTGAIHIASYGSASFARARLTGVKLTNVVAGHGSVQGWQPLEALRARYGAEPVSIAPQHRVMLVKINRLWRPGMTEAELYEVTRQWWRLSPDRKPTYAFAVLHGIVRAVYRIDHRRWKADGSTPPRWRFTGKSDPELTALYEWRDVSAQQGKTQNPIRYVNC